MPTKRLPARPDLPHLEHQARDLLDERRAGKLDACQRIREFHPRFRGATDRAIASATFTLADAYLAVAREYGFPSWARLTAHVAEPTRDPPGRVHHERIQDVAFRRAVELLDDGDVDGLREHLDRHPRVVRQHVVFEGGNYFHEPTLLEFVAENPVRHGSLPPNIVDVARAILDAGAATRRQAIDRTLSLVASGRVPRECGAQVPLIDLLCDFGADPDGAMRPALGHAEWEAADALIRRGAHVDLVVAAATGREKAARDGLASADGEQRHLALALAAQHGHAGIVALLLDAGEDPNRYNPPGAHAHSTPLHQAALAGHLEVVRLLVERGARLDLRDIHHGGRAVEWAEHGGRPEVLAYLQRAAQTDQRG
jgi:ankyrin repeat protein